MRRIGSVVLALAVAAVAAGCSGKSPSKFDTGNTSTTGGGSTGGTTTGSGSGSGSSSGSSGTTGAVDAGPCANLTGATLALFNATSPIALLTGQQSQELQFRATDSNGAALAGCPVTFTEPSSYTTDVAIVPDPAAATTDATGIAKVKVTAGSEQGIAHLLADMQGVQDTVIFNISYPTDAGNPTVDAGPPTPTSIAWQGTTPMNPSILGIAGSGIHEQGTMTFKVTDQQGKDLQGINVQFTQPSVGSYPDGGAQYLITISTPTSTTDVSGNAVVSFSSGPQIGIAEIDATVLDPQTSAPTSIRTSQTIPVRGAKPSAAHFAFYCDKLNLPVYTTPQHNEQMQCHIALADRFSNPVGIPTSVLFYTEAGTISASATTSQYDPQNPSKEGTADVTFTSNMANGFTPVEVDPIAGEPSYQSTVSGQTVTVNPRDRLVTIIAITRGEEAFDDANRDGLYNPGEFFYDETDPYIDENDDNLFDATMPGGPSEPSFASVQNPPGSFSYGNGVWDSNATIWTQTQVVFTGPAAASNVDNAGVVHAEPCLMEKGNFNYPVYDYDDHLNYPAPGTTLAATLSGSPTGLTLSSTGLTTPILDTLGVINTDYVKVAESDGGACTQANGTACQIHLVVTGFDDGAMGSVNVSNTNSIQDGGGPACGTFGVQITTTNAHQVVTQGGFNSGYQP